MPKEKSKHFRLTAKQVLRLEALNEVFECESLLRAQNRLIEIKLDQYKEDRRFGCLWLMAYVCTFSASMGVTAEVVLFLFHSEIFAAATGLTVGVIVAIITGLLLAKTHEMQGSDFLSEQIDQVNEHLPQYFSNLEAEFKRKRGNLEIGIEQSHTGENNFQMSRSPLWIEKKD